MPEQDYYAVLGIRPTASEEEIILAYRGRRAQYHPDKYPTADDATKQWATAKMQEVNEAYDALSDSGRRQQYDANRDDEEDSDAGGGDAAKDGPSDTGADSRSTRNPAQSCFSQIHDMSFAAKLDCLPDYINESMAEFNAIAMVEIQPSQDWRTLKVTPKPLDPDVQRLKKRNHILRRCFAVPLIFGAWLTVAWPDLYFAWILFAVGIILLLAVPASRKVRQEHAQRLAERNRIKASHDKEIKLWDDMASGESAAKYRDYVNKTAKNHLDLIAKVQDHLESLRENASVEQMVRHLEGIDIADSEIPGVGRSRKTLLINHGITSAADIRRVNFFGKDGANELPNIGEAVFRALESWRHSCEAAFVFDPADPAYLDEVAEAERAFEQAQAAFESVVNEADEELQRRIDSVREQRRVRADRLEHATRAMAQAQGDFKLIDDKPFNGAKLIGIVGFVIGCVLVKHWLSSTESEDANPAPIKQSAQQDVPPAVPAPGTRATGADGQSSPVTQDKDYAGTWRGNYVCGGVNGAITGPRGPFSVPVSAVIDHDNRIILERTTLSGGVESLKGTATPATGALGLEGSGENSPDDKWHANYQGVIKGSTLQASGGITPSGSRDVIRSCTITLERGVKVPDASTPAPAITPVVAIPAAQPTTADLSGVYKKSNSQVEVKQHGTSIAFSIKPLEDMSPCNLGEDKPLTANLVGGTIARWKPDDAFDQCRVTLHFTGGGLTVVTKDCDEYCGVVAAESIDGQYRLAPK